MSQAPMRVEHDLLGDRAVPEKAYYGIHTLRALENFPITGTSISIYPDLVRALACVKQAAALANKATLTWEDANLPLPSFELTDLHGKTWQIADLKGKVTLLNFWASW